MAMVNVNARLDPGLVEAVDAHAKRLSRNGVKTTRSDAIRLLVRKGLGKAAPPIDGNPSGAAPVAEKAGA